MNDETGPISGEEGSGSDVVVVTQRLCSIVTALHGGNVGANDDELWFELESPAAFQVRLSGDRQTRCYARSANFAISYGGQTCDERVSACFRAVVDRIKAIDDSPLAGAATAFRAASQAVARRFANPSEVAGDTASDRNAKTFGAGVERDDRGEAARTILDAGVSADSFVVERDEKRALLDTIFLDLCASLSSRSGQPLSALHWGFWPIGTVVPRDYDPLEAFSENLLSYIPDTVTRVLDVGCGRGISERLLSRRGKRVTAVSPVAHHCAVIEHARLPGVDTRCARFEDVLPEQAYDLLLFSESINHFALTDEFLKHCEAFLVRSGFMLIADDLSEDRAHFVETQTVFRVMRSIDITPHVAPTVEWWAAHLPVLAAYRTALLSILEVHDRELADRVRDVLQSLGESELKLLFSGETSAPPPKGRYMIYLLQRE